MIRCEVLSEYGCLCKVSICTQCVVNVRYKFKFNGGDKLHFGVYRLRLYVVINRIFVFLLKYFRFCILAVFHGVLRSARTFRK